MTKAEFESRVMDLKATLFEDATSPDEDVEIPYNKAVLVHELYIDCMLLTEENK